LATWYDRAKAAHGRTTVGISDIEHAHRRRAGDPRRSTTICRPAQALKQAIDDLKAYYLEARRPFPIPARRRRRKEWAVERDAAGCGPAGTAAETRRPVPIRGTRSSYLTLIPATERIVSTQADNGGA